ncbi:hypothetical protein [Anaerostipes butyraticus]|uniref:hypothetical protein n=1 Tax=Anaerostipes butyraticus TaxID=645466 RepID=UPI0032089359
MIKNLKVADIIFQIRSDIDLVWNKYISQFFTSDQPDTFDACYDFYLVPKLPNPNGDIIYHGQDQIIYRHKSGEDRQHFFWMHDEPHMLYRETSKLKEIFYYKKYEHTLTNQYMIFNALAAEKLFLKKNAMILHSSFIIKDGKAILFTAPSGTGKSTQAELWKKYADAEIINGDRSLIQYRNGQWLACGMPICGSSKICLNKEAPISSIIYLEQGKDNLLTPILPAQAVRLLMSETTINFWNQHFVDQVIQLWSNFVSQIPVYHYSCTKEPDAVTTLSNVLRSEL